MPFVEPPREPLPAREPCLPAIPPALRPWLERLRASAIAEANELSRMLGLPEVRSDRQRGER